MQPRAPYQRPRRILGQEKGGKTLAVSSARHRRFRRAAKARQPSRARSWWLTFFAAAFGLVTATVPVYIAFQTDRDLQRTERGVADLHTAYTDALNTADAIIIPLYFSWEETNAAGGPEDLSSTETAELTMKFDSLFPDYNEDSRLFNEAINRLRLVIPDDDAYLISDLIYVLSDYAFYTPDGDYIHPATRLKNFVDTKFTLVNQFRSDTLGLDPLPSVERSQMWMETISNISTETKFRADQLEEESVANDID